MSVQAEDGTNSEIFSVVTLTNAFYYNEYIVFEYIKTDPTDTIDLTGTHSIYSLTIDNFWKSLSKWGNKAAKDIGKEVSKDAKITGKFLKKEKGTVIKVATLGASLAGALAACGSTVETAGATSPACIAAVMTTIGASSSFL